MHDVTHLNPSPSVELRREAAVGGDYSGMYQKEHPTGSLHQIMLGWPGGRVAGWPGGRVAGWPGHECVYSPGRVLALRSGLSA